VHVVQPDRRVARECATVPYTLNLENDLTLIRKASTALPQSLQAVAAGVPKHVARDADVQRKRARTLAKQQQASERVASAASQLASGVTEAASAAEELKRAATQIATGAEEASGAAQESLAAITQVSVAITRQIAAVNQAQRTAVGMQTLAGEINAQVESTVNNVANAAQRQAESVKMVGELERQAANIGEIVKAVARIADQTNLLALNAAQHGKGFAVVADEVRTLAETSEKSAKQIQDLVGQIQGEVKTIAEGINLGAQTVRAEVEKSALILKQLEQIRSDAADIASGAAEIATAATQSNVAAQQALMGAEQIAAASTEQSSACEEANKTVTEQTAALSQCEQTAAGLSEIADELKNSTDIAKSAEEVASSAEELSSAVQEINRSAAQILVALDEIRKGAQTQAAASAESAAAVTQIEKGAEIAQTRATQGNQRAVAIQTLMGENKKNIDNLISGISSNVGTTETSIAQVKDLELVSRKIDKIVDAIAQVSVQTNMLAVNGSIEAARAGDFGKGFVVVATDIRNLAHDSAENADRIKDMVKSIQDQIGLVGRDLHAIVALALSEVEKSRAITVSLNRIEGAVAEVQAGNREAVAAAQEIATAVSQVKIGVEQVSTAAAQAEKAAEQAASAAKQQSQGAEELSAAIEEIASLADELQSA
jgi:methyl-accepting chemotaxis protein